MEIFLEKLLKCLSYRKTDKKSRGYMLAPSYANLRKRTLKAFPERQFIHRTGGQVNYFVLSTRAQVILASLVGAVLLWTLFTFATVLWGQSPLRSSSQELRVQKEQFDRHMVDLDAQVSDARELLGEQQRQFALASQSFEDKHNTIVTMLTQGGIARNEDELSPAKYAQSDVLMSPMLLDVVPRQPRTDLDLLDQMQTGTVLDASFVNLEQDQNRILVSGEAKIQNRIEKNRAILSATGLSVENILKNGSGGVGGPFVALGDDKAKIKPGEFLPRLSSIKARAAEVEALDKALASVPMAYPIDAENYLTSAYGRRKDPFTKRMTMHTGMDIASYRLAPIVATAGGKISFVGRRAGYGKVVEIEHGHGFITRYAHLSKTYVRRGQIVEIGEKIAGMGSTGRSTSTHLHYEVYFEKRAYNPATFMKAGQYVQ